MRRTTFLWILASWIGLGAVVAGAIGADPPKADDPDARPAAAAKATEEFKPPPGFMRKKRGKFILYCKRDAALGTRIKTEDCYDEGQMRNYMLALKETKNNVDKIRSTCSNPCACGQPDAC